MGLLQDHTPGQPGPAAWPWEKSPNISRPICLHHEMEMIVLYELVGELDNSFKMIIRGPAMEKGPESSRPLHLLKLSFHSKTGLSLLKQQALEIFAKSHMERYASCFPRRGPIFQVIFPCSRPQQSSWLTRVLTRWEDWWISGWDRRTGMTVLRFNARSRKERWQTRKETKSVDGDNSKQVPPTQKRRRDRTIWALERETLGISPRDCLALIWDSGLKGHDGSF